MNKRNILNVTENYLLEVVDRATTGIIVVSCINLVATTADFLTRQKRTKTEAIINKTSEEVEECAELVYREYATVTTVAAIGLLLVRYAKYLIDKN